MLAEGIRKLKEGNHIDERLFDWSQQLHAFRNIAKTQRISQFHGEMPRIFKRS